MCYLDSLGLKELREKVDLYDNEINLMLHLRIYCIGNVLPGIDGIFKRIESDIVYGTDRFFLLRLD